MAKLVSGDLNVNLLLRQYTATSEAQTRAKETTEITVTKASDAGNFNKPVNDQ